MSCPYLKEISRGVVSCEKKGVVFFLAGSPWVCTQCEYSPKVTISNKTELKEN